MTRRHLQGCPHHWKEQVVRISCHGDLLSAECRQHPQISMWCCGRPLCRTRCMREVEAFSGMTPVLVHKTQAVAS